MSRLHIRNFTIKVALTKLFVSVSSDSSPILVARSCVTNDKIHAQQTFLGPSKHSNNMEKEKKEKTIDYKAFCVKRKRKKFT